MKIIAYLYSDPLLDSPPDPQMWGFEIDQVYQDLGQREQLQQLLADSRQSPPDYLLVRRIDELGDSLADVGDRLVALEALDIEIMAIEQAYCSSQLDRSSPRQLRGTLAHLWQQTQQQQRSRRLCQGHARNRLKALPPPGKAPYGYRRGKDRYILDRSTAPVVKDFFERFLLFGSLRGAVRYLEKRYGKKISVSTGRRWLSNPVYRGDLAYRNQDIICDAHAPIISRDEAAQIDRLLRRNSQLPSRTASAPRSLAGLVTCQTCGAAMTISRVTQKHKSQEYLYLRAHQCPYHPKCSALPYEKVLQQTITAICRELPQAVAQLQLPNLSVIKTGLNQQINRNQEIIAQLPDLVEQGILDVETAQLRRYKLSTEISQRQARLAQLPPVDLQATAQTVSLPQFWLDLTEEERRFYFREFIHHVAIIRESGQEERQVQLQFIF